MSKAICSRGMELLSTYSRNPSIKLRNQIVQLNVGLVHTVAHRLSQQCLEPYEDLEQVGYLGLIRAIERFNPHQGSAFSSFAMPYIRGEMLHYLRDKGSTVKIPRRWQELYMEGQKVSRQLEAQLGRLPKDTEIAAALEVSVQEWRESYLAVKNRLPISLDSTIARTPDYSLPLGDTLLDPDYQNQLHREEERQQLRDVMSQLEDKTQAALDCVFLLGLPRKEAAKQIGVSPMTVTRHLKRGIEQMVTMLQPQSERLAS